MHLIHVTICTDKYLFSSKCRIILFDFGCCLLKGMRNETAACLLFILLFIPNFFPPSPSRILVLPPSFVVLPTFPSTHSRSPVIRQLVVLNTPHGKTTVHQRSSPHITGARLSLALKTVERRRSCQTVPTACFLLHRPTPSRAFARPLFKHHMHHLRPVTPRLFRPSQTPFG
jgi:hypothetical protein